ncbi:MAG: hypothetical protein H6Q38_634 [Chloroflexi bacterium]|nr:hypothetical protein [Chloroflexota bacterium]
MKLTLGATCMMILLALLAACLPLTTPPPPLPTETSAPTETATPTFVWFPPTPTYTMFPTPSAIGTPTAVVGPEHGALLFSDDFNDPDLWTLGRSQAGSTALGKNELSIAINQPQGYLYSTRQETSLSDFYLEVTANPSICRGEDQYGLLLRLSSDVSYYRFALTCDGRTRLDRIYQGNASAPQAPMYSGAVPPGAPSISRLAVYAQGKEMRFYINDLYQFTVRDGTMLKGTISVFARAAGEDTMTVNFSDLDVYEVGE